MPVDGNVNYSGVFNVTVYILLGHVNGLAQDCGNSSDNALELPHLP